MKDIKEILFVDSQGVAIEVGDTVLVAGNKFFTKEL